MVEKTKGLSKNILTGTAGEYFVCAELLKNNIVATLAPKNNPEIDIIAITQDGSRFANIQVKTRANKQGWKMNTAIEEARGVKNFFVVLVNLTEQSPEYYIFKRDELATLIKKNHLLYLNTPKRDGERRKDVSFRWLDMNDKHFPKDLREKTKDKWERLNLF